MEAGGDGSSQPEKTLGVEVERDMHSLSMGDFHDAHKADGALSWIMVCRKVCVFGTISPPFGSDV